MKGQAHQHQQLFSSSKDIYIQYLIDIIRSNGLSYSSYPEQCNLDDLMAQTCSYYNRLKRNKVMYLMEDREDDFIVIDEEEKKKDEEEEDDDEVVIRKDNLNKYKEPSLKDLESLTETQINDFRTIRTYRKVLKALCNARSELLRKVSLKTYGELVWKHLNIVLSVCQEKEYPKAKIFECMELSLTWLDTRVLSYHMTRGRNHEIDVFLQDQMSKKEVLPEEISYLKDGLTKTQYLGNNLPNILQNFTNYGSCVIRLKELLEMYITKETGVIYLRHKDDDETIEADPFRFYFLSKETNKKRYWGMDCRLDDFTRSLVKNLGLYLVEVFRCMYNDVFKDNVYRQEFGTNTLMKNDGDQLLKNVCELSRYSTLSDTVRFFVKSKYSYDESERDVFVLRSDDTLLRNELVEKKGEVNYDLIMMLFDDLKIENAEEIFSTYG